MAKKKAEEAPRRCEADGCMDWASGYALATLCPFHQECAMILDDIEYALDIPGDSSWPRSHKDKAEAGERLRDRISKLLSLTRPL